MNMLGRFAAGALALSAVLPATARAENRDLSLMDYFFVPAYGADFMSFVPGRADATFPLGATDYFPLIPNGGSTKKVAGNLMATRSGAETLTNKTLTNPTINAATFTGTIAAGTSTISGNITLSGAYKSTGLSSGTIVSGKYMGLDSGNNVVLGSVGSGSAAGSTGDYQKNSSGSFAAVTPGSGVDAAFQVALGASGGLAPAGCVAAGTTQTISASTHWQTYCLFNVTTASQTLTLPAVSTLSTNGGIAIKTVGQSVTLAPNASDAINGGSTGASVVIPPNGFSLVNTSGANAITASGLGGTIASGTSALGTSSISSGACATVVTTSATGTATTDVITAGFSGDPTGVTGYAPSSSGMLTIISYPSSNNVNFKVCNNTSSSITPGAVTLNWRVAR